MPLVELLLDGFAGDIVSPGVGVDALVDKIEESPVDSELCARRIFVGSF